MRDFFFNVLFFSQISEENETNDIILLVSLSQTLLNPLTKFNQIPQRFPGGSSNKMLGAL